MGKFLMGGGDFSFKLTLTTNIKSLNINSYEMINRDTHNWTTQEEEATWSDLAAHAVLQLEVNYKTKKESFTILFHYFLN